MLSSYVEASFVATIDNCVELERKIWATLVIQSATGHDPEPLATALFFHSVKPILELKTPQNLFILPTWPLSTGFPTIIQNACIACRILVKCTEIHLSFPSRPVGDWFPRSYEVNIGGAISQMLLNMRSIFSGEFYLQFERQICVCVLPAFMLRLVCTRYWRLSGGQDLQFFWGGGGACLVRKHVAGLLGQRIGPSQGHNLHRTAQKLKPTRGICPIYV